jgi:aspartate carbamoyltransferase catalytic subunit
MRWHETADLEAVLPEVDVVYQTRIQRERFDDEDAYSRVRGVYVLGPETMKRLRPHAIVMHPLPRLDEIDRAVDGDPRAAYFRQARNGVHVRMALLDMVLS